MNTESLFLGLLPLLAFVVVDIFAGMRSALLSAVIFAVGEVVYSIWMYHTIDALTVGSFLLVTIFAFFSYRSQNPVYFKLQPVVLGLAFALAFLIFQWMGQPLLLVMMEKYQYMIPEEAREVMLSDTMKPILIRSSVYLGWGFFIHALLVGYSAWKLSNWWWLALRGIGVYVMMGICMWMAR